MIYDLSEQCVVDELTDYAIDLAVRRQMSPLTVEKRARQAMLFWSFIESERLSPLLLTTRDLVRYRDAQHERITSSHLARGDIQTSKRTVNDLLSGAREWLAWTRKVDQEKFHGTQSEGHARCQDLTEMGQVAYRRVGHASKHRVGLSLDAEGLDHLRIGLLANSENLYVTLRNTLIADIANEMGLRRGSINSLLVSQFNRQRLESETRTAVVVRPVKQKFGYDNDFLFPVSLALRICDFIDEIRCELVSRKKVGKSIHQDRVFLSSRDARPLTDRAITKIFSAQLRLLGCAQGTSIHSIRHKFVNDRIRREIECRLQAGMDTSTESISVAVALALGQRNSKSLYAYVTSMQTQLIRTHNDKDG